MADQSKGRIKIMEYGMIFYKKNLKQKETYIFELIFLKQIWAEEDNFL